MSVAELERMVGQPPLARWQFMLEASSGATLRALSAMVCRILLTPDIVKHSEIDKLQIALQVCTFYNTVKDEEAAQNLMILLLDCAAKHKECLDFVGFLTSVAASSRCRLFLQTFALQTGQAKARESICQRVISDNCIQSKSYSDLCQLSRGAPQFVLLILRHTLNQIVQLIRDSESPSYLPSLLDFSLSLCEQHESNLNDPGILSAALFVTVCVEGNELSEKVFRIIFKRVSAKESAVKWAHLKEVAGFLGEVGEQGKELPEKCKDRLNQLILVMSHNRLKKEQVPEVLPLIQRTEFGGMLLEAISKGA